MNRVIDPALTACPECPDWQVACDSDEQKHRLEEVHAHAKHGVALTPRPVAGSNWQEQAVDAVRQVAARGRDFRIFDALAEFGLQSPPDAQHKLGRFTTLVHDMGVCHKVGYGPSNRKGTRGSAAGIWNRDPARCIEGHCRKRAGLA